MRIGYLIQQGIEIRRPPFDGPANHVREVVAELGRRGHAVRVLMRQDGQLWCSDGLGEARPVRVQRADSGLPRLVERGVRRLQSALRLPYANWFESRRFALAVGQELADCLVLLERQTWMGYGGALAAGWLNVPLVVEYNGDHLHDLEAKHIAPKGLQRRLALALMGWANRRAAHIVATGDGWRDHYVEQWRCDPRRVSVVENGTAVVRLLERAQLRAFDAASADGQPITLVYLGGFYAWHGVPVLIRALAQACARGLALRLVLIGSGAGEAEARQLVNDLGLGPQVEFAGQLTAEAFAPRLAAADIGLSPYCGWKEFSGLKLFDYKAAGLAIIASGRDGQPATLKHGHTALIVPPCDEAALTEAIVQLATDARLRRQLGQQARAEAENCHGWDMTARGLERIFKQVAAAHG